LVIAAQDHGQIGVFWLGNLSLVALCFMIVDLKAGSLLGKVTIIAFHGNVNALTVCISFIIIGYRTTGILAHKRSQGRHPNW
jgi:hypothetical protein